MKVKMNRKLVAECYDNFSRTTVIRVFNFIGTSPFLGERIFWLLVLLGFAALTAWNTTQTVQTFLSEPTASQVSLISNASAGLNFSSAQICLQMQSATLLKLYTTNTTAIDNIIADFQHIIEAVKEKLAKIFKSEDQRGATLQSNLTNSTPIEEVEASLTIYHQFEPANFDVFTREEIELFALTTAMFVRLIDFEINPKRVDAGWQSPTVRKLYEAYTSKRTNTTELLGLTSQMLCVLLQLRLVSSRFSPYSTVNEYTPYNFCKRASLEFFGYDSHVRVEIVCFENFPLFYRNSLDMVTISAHPEAFYTNGTHRVLQRIIVDLAGMKAWEQQPPLLPAFVGKQTVKFSIETISTSVNLRRSGCLAKGERRGVFIDCVSKCRIEAIIAACGCRPLIEEFLPDFVPRPSARNLQHCSEIATRGDVGNFAADDQTCRVMRSSTEPIENCSQECSGRNCETFLFTSTTLVGDPSLDYLNATTVLRLMSAKFVYEKIDEYVTMDWRGFVTALGGNLSLYLGASFLALIHIVVFCLKIPYEMVLLQRSESSTSTASAASATTANQNGLGGYNEFVNQIEERLKALADEVSELRKRVH